MPIREYECPKCGHREERLELGGDRPLRKCPQCGGRVQRLLSAPAFQFKGSGWYVTDYARKGGAENGSSAGEAPSSGEKSSGDEKGASTAGESEAGGKSSKKSPVTARPG